MYRLVFCDLDGTVLTFQRELRPAVKAAMQAVVDRGHWITLSSGRGYQLLKPLLGRVPVNAPLVCCNGSLVVEPRTRRVLYLKPMPIDMAHSIVRWCQQSGEQVWVYLDDMETVLEYSPTEPGATLRSDGALQRIDDPISAITRPPHKLFLLPGSPDRIPDVVSRLQRHVGDRARVLASSPKTIEVVLPGTSKAKAMALVAKHLGVSRQETMAAGDGDNDVEMLEWAGLGVAMGNATPAVKAVASWEAPSVDDDGLAIALRKFVLQQA